jgi:hypothetical protein
VSLLSLHLPKISERVRIKLSSVGNAHSGACASNSLQWEMRIPRVGGRIKLSSVGNASSSVRTEGERVSASENRRMQRMADDGTRRPIRKPSPRGFPIQNLARENVHLAPTLLGETRGVLTVRGGPRAKSQRLQ